MLAGRDTAVSQSAKSVSKDFPLGQKNIAKGYVLQSLPGQRVAYPMAALEFQQSTKHLGLV
jgi:hypothetical protein